MRHREGHFVHRVGWLRAAVLGANDGIVSTASLILGVAASGANSTAILVAGIAGLVAGAMSMAAGEFVSVSSQADTEQADLAREKQELEETPQHELAELSAIYEQRGLDKALAAQVAIQLTAHDALGAHARDELGISDTMAARPIQAALASACSFSVGAALPIVITVFVPTERMMLTVSVSSLLFLGLLGVISARAGGAPMLLAARRVTFWGAMAMLATAGVGTLFSVSS